MASAWGRAWGSSWGNSWGFLGAAPAATKDHPIAGAASPRRRVRRWPIESAPAPLLAITKPPVEESDDEDALIALGLLSL